MSELRTIIRQPLTELIPLAVPFLIRIDPSNLCNFKCEFCPTGDSELLKSVGRPKGIMDFELFCRIIDEISSFPTKLKKLYFYKDGEPLINKKLPEMIAYATSKQVAEEYWITTNGSLLNPEINNKLINAGLNLIRISIEAVTSEGYEKIAKVKIDYEKLKENIAHLYSHRKDCRIHIKIVDYGLSEDEKRKFYQDFESISTSIHIDSLMGWSMSEAKDFKLGTNSIESPDGQQLIRKEVCPFPFYTLTINFDGTVSVCCVDWSHSTVVGDLRENSLVSIWRGAKLQEFRKMHLEKRRFENRACGNCDYLNTLQDNLDNDAESILKKILSSSN